MLSLSGTKLSRLPIEGLSWVADLAYYEGPIISHYRHERGDDHYLCCWVDCEGQVNRWMWARVNENHVIRLANRMESLDQVVPVECQDDFVYFVDGGQIKDLANVTMIAIRDIPVDYKPDVGSLLRPNRPSDDNSFPILIDRVSLDGLGDIPRTFSQAYNILYLVASGPSQEFLSHPWRGGFSSMHFYNELDSLIPSEAKVDLKKVQLSSPGFIRFTLHRQTAERVSHCVELVSKRGSHANKQFTALGSYIHKNALTHLPRDSAKWKVHDTELVKLTKRLLDALEFQDPMSLIGAARRPFEAAQIARSICSRLRALARYQKDGIISLPAV